MSRILENVTGLLARRRATAIALAVLVAALAAIGSAATTGDGADSELSLTDGYRSDAPSDLAELFDVEKGAPRPMNAGPSGAFDGDTDPAELSDALAAIDWNAGAGEPIRVTIPTLGVRAPVEPTGLNRDGTAEVPSSAGTIGWYQPLGPFDDAGGQVLAGHISWRGETGTFADIGTLETGDQVQITTGDGTRLTYKVDHVELLDKDHVPLADIYDATGPEQLTLITCGGVFNQRVGHYDSNWVVTAQPA